MESGSLAPRVVDNDRDEITVTLAGMDGGPAFPAEFQGGEGSWWQEGMSLRDHFAALAMQAIIAKSPFLAEPQTFDVYDKTAIGAYDYADAMLAARTPGSTGEGRER